MQTSTARRYSSTIMPIEIRKVAIINSSISSSGGGDPSTSMLTPPIQQNDNLSPNVGPIINPFEVNLNKSIQEQLSRTTSDPIIQPNLNHNLPRSTLSNQSTQSNNGHIIPLNNSINLKKSITVGKYLLFDVLSANSQTATTQNDITYNLAVNLIDKKSYCWKVNY